MVSFCIDPFVLIIVVHKVAFCKCLLVGTVGMGLNRNSVFEWHKISPHVC